LTNLTCDQMSSQYLLDEVVSHSKFTLSLLLISRNDMDTED